LDYYTRLKTEFGSYVGWHATYIAGILVGNGSLNSSYEGIASSSNVYAYQLDNPMIGTYLTDLTDNFEYAINNNNVNLGSNSWGTPISGNCSLGGDYTEFSDVFDKFIYGNFTNNKISQVIATGNYRDDCGYAYNTLTPESSSKNSISVGGVLDDLSLYQQSGLGPTDASRIKPELVAPGCVTSTDIGNTYTMKCGTSMAAPHVSGTIALMLEQWNKSGNTEDPLPSTIKALLLDSTTDLHKDGTGEQVIDGPDYVNGFGLLNAKEAVDRIINNTFLEENLSNTNDVDVYSIEITNTNEPIKVTLVWDDVPGATLINNLDLKLIAPSGDTFYPWTLDPSIPNDAAVRTKADDKNNVEQVYVFANETSVGEWLIVVDSSTLIEEQMYSVVSEYDIETNLTGKDFSFDFSWNDNINQPIGGSTPTYYGVKVLAKENISITNVSKDSTSHATTAYIYDSSGNQLAYAAFSNNIAIFNPPYELIRNMKYRVVAGSGSNYYSITKATNFNYQTDNNDLYDILQGSNQLNDYGFENENSGLIFNVGEIGFKKEYSFLEEDIVLGNSIWDDGINQVLGGSTPSYYGVKVLAKKDISIVNISKDSISYATKAYICDSNGVKLAESSFISNVATFNPPFQLSLGNKYRIVAGKDGVYYNIGRSDYFNYQNDNNDLYDILQASGQFGDYGAENAYSGNIYNIGAITFQE
jgi:hypothetical protein